MYTAVIRRRLVQFRQRRAALFGELPRAPGIDDPEMKSVPSRSSVAGGKSAARCRNDGLRFGQMVVAVSMALVSWPGLMPARRKCRWLLMSPGTRRSSAEVWSTIRSQSYWLPASLTDRDDSVAPDPYGRLYRIVSVHGQESSSWSTSCRPVMAGTSRHCSDRPAVPCRRRSGPIQAIRTSALASKG